MDLCTCWARGRSCPCHHAPDGEQRSQQWLMSTVGTAGNIQASPLLHPLGDRFGLARGRLWQLAQQLAALA
jgi:hypothetical protein